VSEFSTTCPQQNPHRDDTSCVNKSGAGGPGPQTAGHNFLSQVDI